MTLWVTKMDIDVSRQAETLMVPLGRMDGRSVSPPEHATSKPNSSMPSYRTRIFIYSSYFSLQNCPAVTVNSYITRR